MRRAYRAVIVLSILVLIAAPAHALWQNEDYTFKMIGKFKTQGSYRLQDSEPNTPLPVKAGDMTSQRNLLMLEIKHNLGTIGQDWKCEYYLQGRAFYDGVWDYGAKEWSDDEFRREYLIDNREEINEEKKKAEFYMANIDFSKGFFLSRTGRQSLAWGEMSTVRILDGTNPLNTSSMSVDMLERRIPLWMQRFNFAFENVGPFYSCSIETYYIPGRIDNTYEEKIVGGSPLTPTIGRYTTADLEDPFSIASLMQNIEQADSEIDKDRYGIKLGLMYKGLDLNFAYYRMYSDMPVPKLNLDSIPNVTIDPSNLDMNNIFSTALGGRKMEVELWRDTVDVFGTSFNYNIGSIDAVIRGEAAYFKDVPKISPGGIMPLMEALSPKITVMGMPGGIGQFLGMLPLGNLGTMTLPFVLGEVPKYNVIKYGVAFDKWIKIPFISNSDIMTTTEYVGSKILKYQPDTILFPWQAPWDDNHDGNYDTVYEPKYSNTIVSILRAEYLNANLITRLVSMFEFESRALVLMPSVEYDWRRFQFVLDFATYSSRDYNGIMGMLNKHDEVTFAVTYSF